LYPIFSTAYNKIEAALSKYEDAEWKSRRAGKDEGTVDIGGGIEGTSRTNMSRKQEL
jgi:hypothetical protein